METGVVTSLLVAMPEGTYRRVMTPERESELHTLGDVVLCFEANALSEDAYGALWEKAEAVVTGWGVRAPTPAILDRARSLRIISHTAGSVRWLPRYALEKGIIVTSAQAAIAPSVAEYCLMTALVLLRRYFSIVQSSSASQTETLYGKTVGLIGFGHVARLFRQHLAPFHCRVLVSDPALSAEDAREQGVERADLATVLQHSRIISLHAPDIPATRGMIGPQELRLIPDGAIFLNSARGRLVDTEALTEELQTGRFSAALDVTEPEPLPPDHPLRTLPHVLLTPHIAGPTDDELPEMTRMALTDLERFLNGVPPLHPISLETYDQMSF